MTERVLGVPTERLNRLGSFQGFRPFDPALFAGLLDPAHLEYRVRAEAEVDPTFKQLIPYVVLRHGGALFHYTRGGGTETRLRARRSVGVGGHIDFADAGSGDPYRTGMRRELAEEVRIACGYTERPLGLINDDSTPVGSVHLGVVHLLELDAATATPREAGLTNAGFAPLAELLRSRDEFESWSRLVMEAM